MECFRLKCFFNKLVVICFLVILCWVLRYPIAEKAASYLMSLDKDCTTDVAFVLSGNPIERASLAVELWHAAKLKRVVCTGSNHSPLLQMVNMDLSEAELTRLALRELDFPEAQIDILPEGTSTKEEAELILDYCIEHNLHQIMLISNLFHCRRVRFVFEELFSKNEISICIQGKASKEYNENKWWLNEEGIIAFYNEYAKLIYYNIKAI